MVFVRREGLPVMWQEAPVSAIQVLGSGSLEVHMHMSACGVSTLDVGVELSRVQLAIACETSPQKWHCVWLLDCSVTFGS